MVNIKEVQEAFNMVIKYSQKGIDDPKTDELFENWHKAKREFIELFGGNLIYEYPEKVYFEIGEKEKELRVNDFASTVRYTYNNPDLADFIETNKKVFFLNRLEEPYAYRDTIIKPGMKLLRAFKYFEKDKVTLDKIQQAASMVIQENKIGGTLCLSVHPLDFLSSSENNHQWRSCHALDGEYRAGNLSYMLDKSTIMCYLRSDDKVKLPNFPDEVPWNSKKWRVLLFLSDNWDMIFAGRQYPFTTQTGIDFVKNNVLNRVGIGSFTKWTDKKVRSVDIDEGNPIFMRYPYVAVGGSLKSMKDLIIDAPNSRHFNDLLHSSCYDPMFAYRVQGNDIFRRIVTLDSTVFHIGGSCNCLRCNEFPIGEEGTMMCPDCEMSYGDTSDDEYYGSCPCCGRRFAWDDGVWVDGAEETICPDCADEYTISCACCGEVIYTDDAMYDRNNDEMLCRSCYEERQEEYEVEEERIGGY